MRILLVEDDEAVSTGISMLLRMEGSAVDQVRQGSQALVEIEKFVPDVVVLDIGLPDVNGVEVYKQIETRWPALPVLLSSGQEDVERIARNVDRPNVSFLFKPYDFSALRDQLTRLLGAA